MKGKTCFFIGHHDAPEAVFPALFSSVKHHIEQNVNFFIVGNYGSFDRMAARAVIMHKANHPEITLSLLSPYHPCETEKPIPMGFDEIIYPFGCSPPRPFAIIKANQYAVKNADYLIAYVRYPFGNAYKMLQYAQRKAEKSILEITLL